MQNFSFIYLNVLSSVSLSPFFAINHQSNTKFSLISNSHFSRFYSSIIYSNTQFHSTIINNNAFSNFLDTPIIFTEDYESYCIYEYQLCCEGGSIFNEESDTFSKNITHYIFDKSGPYFLDACGNLTILRCLFLHCYTDRENGGGILIEQDCDTVISECIFINCSSDFNGCGGAVARKIIVEPRGDPEHDLTHFLNISYVCFLDCIPRHEYGFGATMLIGASEVVIFFSASTIISHQECTPWGANFDILGDFIRLYYNNITGGRSVYCSAVEYRETKEGFFRFQTLTGMEGKIVISFTPLDKEKLDLSYCNICENVVQRPESESSGGLYPSIIYYQKNPLYVDNFRFYRNSLLDDAVIAQTYGATINPIHFNECIADFEYEHIIDLDIVVGHDCHWFEQFNITFIFEPIFDDDCKYHKITPPPISYFFSKSDMFSLSNHFTSSKHFDATEAFTLSNKFTASSMFSSSKHFDETEAFTPSNKFTASSVFTFSNSFPLPTQSVRGQVISSEESYSESLTVVKTVTMSNIVEESYTSTAVFNEELGEYSQSFVMVYVSKMLPYLIYVYSPTVVETVLLHQVNQDKKLISPEKLIGIVCGVVAAVFGTAGIVLLFLKKRNESYYFSDDLTDSSFENETKASQKTQETKVNTEIIDSEAINANQKEIDIDWL